MGYSGIRIPGHSGTDFKHRKAFVISKKRLENEQRTEGTRIAPREEKTKYSWKFYLKIAILYSLLLMIILAISSLV